MEHDILVETETDFVGYLSGIIHALLKNFQPVDEVVDGLLFDIVRHARFDQGQFDTRLYLTI